LNQNSKIPDLSIVVLCYRSGEDVKHFTNKIINVLKDSEVVDYEIVLVGNYFPESDDKTHEVVKKLSSSNDKICFVAEPKQKGNLMGWDMRCGFNKARGRYILIIDGDGQMPAEDIIKVYKKIKIENLDLVKTFRVTRGDSYRRIIISLSYNFVFRLLFPGLGSRDINSKPKIIKQEKYALLNLKNNGWCIDAEIMIKARQLKFKIGEIPTNFLGLEGRRKSFVKFPAIWEFTKFLLRYRYKELFKKNENTNYGSIR
jgi:glycosyltransferase involved in cell wall biosynthesis